MPGGEYIATDSFLGLSAFELAVIGAILAVIGAIAGIAAVVIALLQLMRTQNALVGGATPGR